MTSTSELLLRHDQKRPRTQQAELGMSDVGTCRRRAKYRLSGTKPTNPGGSVQAVLGSAIHDVIAKEMAAEAEPGDLVEYEVHFAGLKGHLDRFEAATATIVDVKTTSSRWLDHIKLHGPDEAHKWQVHLYGAALVKEGRTVRRVRIDYIARDTGEEYATEAPFRPNVYTREALNWLQVVRAAPLEAVPRDYTPDSAFCRSCPFSDACWPDGLTGPSAMRVLFDEDPDVERWANELWEAREDKKAAAEREKRARGALESVRPADGFGMVATRTRVLRFQSNGLFFASSPPGPIPALGYHEEAS